MKHAHLSKFGKCECDENFIEKNGRCICDEKESDLIGDKCLLKPGKHEERIINGDDVDYRCESGYEYDKNRFCKKEKTMPKSRPIEQCYDKNKGFWLIIYDNGTRVCNNNGNIKECPKKSCSKINKQNENKL